VCAAPATTRGSSKNDTAGWPCWFTSSADSMRGLPGWSWRPSPGRDEHHPCARGAHGGDLRGVGGVVDHHGVEPADLGDQVGSGAGRLGVVEQEDAAASSAARLTAAEASSGW
jgi:hypothetical protein